MTSYAQTARPNGGQPRPADGPYGSRLLAGWYETGRSADLTEHLRRHGAPPRYPAEVLLDAVERSGLTGRGGGGFPTGRKLRTVAAAGARRRRGVPVVVGNGMESEPASRKDDTLLAIAPHLVLDGLVLAAAAVGADEAHLCLPRTEPERIAQLEAAVAERERRRVDPSGLSVQVHALPHHFVSSEETSLVRWLNGGEARPLATPPRPFERGVGKRPTLIDNVETLAQLALIARHGPDWFRAVGTAEDPGTALVTVSGAVAVPGVYEAPLGTPVAGLLQLAGGVTAAPLALLAGGSFGTWLPADTPQATGRRGAGILTALPQGACGLSETAAMLRYLAGQSARQCGPCRLGLPAAAEDFAQLAWGSADPELPYRLRERLGLLPGRGACRHPDGASRLAASALELFAEDAQRHLYHGPCPGAHRPITVPLPEVAVPGEDEWR
ncbi:NADH-ubiquinone oxidoreductase-F iron-sulfur binding region domain-containing protein [Phaeacidiphilus oryzae]|uniref:NADH-ubiquinone oxidoreductase-F iron-sulfur binding region domain-containing protein n=1 Tax=Phaeacidiphilus oryzae TaxID=348818 RepID=UPI0007C7CCBE|nr:NADH-ubiquinone oxidoreductase-F iron-sulfur binding region domain-containing protein [Phaeacidiphilus oryzae]